MCTFIWHTGSFVLFWVFSRFQFSGCIIFLQVITILPSYIYICIIHIYKGFQYKMNENMKWRISHMCPQNNNFRTERLGLPLCPVVKNPPCIAEDSGLIPVWGAKFSHAVEQLSPHSNCRGHTTTRESVCPKERSCLNLNIFLKKKREIDFH